jgi:hypothetical protein
MAYIQLSEFEDMSLRIQEKARPILEKVGTLGDIFKLLAVREDVYFATDGMVQAYLLAETELPWKTAVTCAWTSIRESPRCWV